MNADEIITKWNKEHPAKATFADDAQQLLQMLANGDAKNASALAAEIAKRKAEENATRKEEEIKRLEHILDNFDNDDSFLNDHSLGEIWSLTMKADGKAEEYIDSVLSTWKAPFQQALETYREAIEKLCTRWGFASIGTMLRFIFDKDLSDINFCEKEGGDYYSLCAHASHLSDPDDDFYTIEHRLGGFVVEYIQKNKDSMVETSLAKAVLEIRENNEDDFAVVLCEAVFICFYPDAIKSVCDAENVLATLFCFLNASTMIGVDEAVRKARLKKRIAVLKEAPCGAPES